MTAFRDTRRLSDRPGRDSCTPMAAAALTSLIADLADAFPRAKVNEQTLRLYMRELDDLPHEALAVAVQDLIRSEEFFPSVRAVRAATAERLLALPSEQEALEQVEQRIHWARINHEDDSSTSPPYVHPLVRQAINHVGGYFAFRASDKPEVVRGQFLKMYQQLRTNRIRAVQIDGGRSLTAADERRALPA